MDFYKLNISHHFEWDKWNTDKIRDKHKVEYFECEEVFFDDGKVILKDVLHSGNEERYILIGKTKKDKLLFIVFTIRNEKIRVVSARPTNKKEARLYEKAP